MSGLPPLSTGPRASRIGSFVPIAGVIKAEHDAEEFQTAMRALFLVAEHNGPTMFARIGVMKP
jgi:hypothetical protein